MSLAAKQPALASDAHRRRILAVASATATLATLLLTVAAAQLPLFDSSPRVVLPPPEDGRFSLRHVLASTSSAMGREGYTYEYQWAFFPGSPFVMRITASSFFGASSLVRMGECLLGCLVSLIPSVLSALRLYDLSLLHLGSRNAAFLAALLSLLPSSPVTLRLAGYAEPFFTYLSYTGMLYCARGRWLHATCSFILACTFRSNGIFLSGFILWCMLVDPFLNHKKISLWRATYALLLSALTVAPFVYHQYSAYRAFCTNAVELAPWCNAFPPSIYTYVQSNFAAPELRHRRPALVLLLTFTLYYLRAALFPRLRDFAFGVSSRTAHMPAPEDEDTASEKRAGGGVDDIHNRPHSGAPHTLTAFLNPSIAPHAIHGLLMTLLLLFASHTQIVLRQAASMPVLYWAAAWLLVERPVLGKWWIGWSVVWGTVSCVLWGAFLPPA
ncbi:GPI mannosyltransferase 2 [Cerioporus squamosus]|nr:GPI mannosyltransferase 2 [Cerioporus squamosus]